MPEELDPNDLGYQVETITKHLNDGIGNGADEIQKAGGRPNGAATLTALAAMLGAAIRGAKTRNDRRAIRKKIDQMLDEWGRRTS